MTRRLRSLPTTADSRTGLFRIPLKIFGVLFLLGGLSLLGQEIRFGQSVRSVPGKIIDVRVIENTGGTNYAPVVEFTPQDGRVVHFQGTSTRSKPVEGTQVTVLYDITRPEGAKVDSFVRRWLVPTIIIPIGLLMIFGATWRRNDRIS